MSRKNTRFISRFGRVGEGITTVDSWSARPDNPESGDLFMISGTRQIYRSPSGGSWTEGWHPDVSTISNANPGNIQDEAVVTDDENLYFWDTSRSEWVRSGIELVDSYSNRPASPDSGDLIMVRSTGQIYRSDGSDYNEGWHPSVITIEDANDGNVDGEVIHTDDSGGYEWNSTTLSWEQPLGDQAFKTKGYPVTVETIVGIIPDGPELRDSTDRSEKLDYGRPRENRIEVTRVDDPPELRRSTFSKPAFNLSTSRALGMNADPFPSIRNVDEVAAYKMEVDSTYSVFYAGSNWSVHEPFTTATLRSVEVVSSSNIWVCGHDTNDSVWNYDGSNWTGYPTSTSERLLALDHVSSTDIWAVGDGVIIYWDGSSWSNQTIPSSTAMKCISMLSSSEGWAGGFDGATWQWDGSSWTDISNSISDTLRGAAFESSSSGWFVGDNGGAYQWGGSSFTSVSTPVTSTLRDVNFDSTGDAWACGDNGVILEWDGSSWTEMTTPVTSTLWGIYMVNDVTGWAVGDGGTILHWDGVSWAEESSTTSETLYDTFFDSESLGWAVGGNGANLSRET